MHAGWFTRVERVVLAAVLAAMSTGCAARAVPVGGTEPATVRIDSCGEVTAKLHSRPWHARDLAPVGWAQAGAGGEERGSVHYESKTEATFVAEDGGSLVLWHTADSDFQCRAVAVHAGPSS